MLKLYCAQSSHNVQKKTSLVEIKNAVCWVYFSLLDPSWSTTWTCLFLSSSSTGINVPGRFIIFTVNKSAEYSISVWLRFSDPPGNSHVTLWQTSMENERKISSHEANKIEICFLDKFKLAKGSKINITIPSSCTDSLFHMYERWVERLTTLYSVCVDTDVYNLYSLMYSDVCFIYINKPELIICRCDQPINVGLICGF